MIKSLLSSSAADHTPGGANTMCPRRRPYGTLMLGLQLCIGLRGGGRRRHSFYL